MNCEPALSVHVMCVPHTLMCALFCGHACIHCLCHACIVSTQFYLYVDELAVVAEGSMKVIDTPRVHVLEIDPVLVLTPAVVG